MTSTNKTVTIGRKANFFTQSLPSFDEPGAGRDNQFASLGCVRLLGHRQVMLRCKLSSACTGLFNTFVLGVVVWAHGADGTQRVGSEPHREP